jgi:hypothetical protein
VIVHPKVAAIGPAQFLKRVEKSCDPVLTFAVGFCESPNQHADPACGFGGLRVPGQWPESDRATDKREEFAPFHCHPPQRVAPSRADLPSGHDFRRSSNASRWNWMTCLKG